ncbi:MAG: hypothetical protein LBD01_04540 [Puniceicoccales bacterium]|jgi:hypothetical protein|nr:hypothetical protein [Puniceicoccales bacterium]
MATSHAAGWSIYHKTQRPKIDLQIAIPLPSQEEVARDCEERRNVGIGEKVDLKILPADLPDADETVWTIEQVTGEVEATLKETKKPTPGTAQSIVIESAQKEAGTVFKGAKATFETKVKKIQLGGYAVVRATLKNGEYEEIVFNVALPKL